MTDRLVSNVKKEADAFEATIRPQSLDEFIGQEQARANLKIFIQAAKSRGDALDHVLFAGPPGLGKTTLAQIMAKELGVGFRATSGPVISKAGDLAALLTNLEERDVLFIDEIHRLNPAVEEILYPAMEDFQLDLIIGEGPAARSVRIDLSKFTLVGATTRAGLLTNPLRDRFGIPIRLNFYTIDELELVVSRGARVLGLQCGPMAPAKLPAGRAARRASPVVCSAACAILPPWRTRPRLRPKSLITHCACWRSITKVSTRSIIAISGASPRTTMAGLSALRRWQPLCRSRVMPSRRLWSPICCNRDSSAARREGGC